MFTRRQSRKVGHRGGVRTDVRGTLSTLGTTIVILDLDTEFGETKSSKCGARHHRKERKDVHQTWLHHIFPSRWRQVGPLEVGLWTDDFHSLK